MPRVGLCYTDRLFKAGKVLGTPIGGFFRLNSATMSLTTVVSTVALACFLAAAEARSTPPPVPQCGRPVVQPVLQPEERILGGTEAVPGSWPWHAELLLPPILPQRYFCGGALIDSRHILTASHCVRYLPPMMLSMVRVHLGSHRRETTDPTELDVGVEHVCQHRASYKTYNDIAILKLKKEVPFSDFIQPVCLPEYSINDTLPADTEVYATGWGRTDRDDEDVLSDVLKQLKMTTMSENDCQERVAFKLLDTTICTEHTDGSTCHGDSGGPMVRRDDNGTWFLEGVLSGGPRVCGTVTAPMRFTRVSRFVRWVNEYRRRDAEGALEDFCKPVKTAPALGAVLEKLGLGK